MSLTYAQRLALDHRERTNGYEDDLSLAEQFEVEDQAFRHWDTFIFARQVASAADGTGRARERGGAASSSDDASAAPNTCPPGDMESPAHAPAPEPVGSEAGASGPTPSGVRPGLASPSVERWMWTA